MDLSRTHPLYDLRKLIWQYNRDHFEGGRTLTTGLDVSGTGSYLHKFELEQQESFTQRLNRSPGLYENLPKFALATYNAQLFRVEPRRVLPPGLDELQNDVDLRRTNATDFFFNVATHAQLYGISFVLIDAPAEVSVLDEQSGEQRPLTELERQQLRLRPWFEEVSPFQVLDWEIELQDNARRGQLKWVVIHDPIPAPRAPGDQPGQLDRYRVYWPDHFEVWLRGAKGAADQLIAQGTYGIGEVPLVPFYDKRDGPMCGSTILDDIALASNALWNAASVRDESYQYQGFNQLIIRTEDKTLNELKVGQNRALKLGSPTDEAYYLTPSSVPFDAYEKLRLEIVERTRDLVFNRTQRQLDTAQVESAEKRKMDRDEFIALLQRKADNFEAAELLCWKLAGRFAGLNVEAIPEDQLAIHYNRDFSVIITPADEWEKRIKNGVSRHEDWLLELDPGLSEEEATAKVEENLKLAAERMPGTLQAQSIQGAGNLFKPGEEPAPTDVPPVRAVPPVKQAA